MTDAVHDAWEPLEPRDGARLLRDLPIRWWIAGGWALELGGVVPARRHRDLDVAILRPEHEHLRAAFPDWDLRIANDGVLTPWRGDAVRLPANGIWARPGGSDRWLIDFKIELVDGDEWVYRRDPAVRRPLDAIGRTTPDGIPYLAPDVAKLYARLG